MGIILLKKLLYICININSNKNKHLKFTKMSYLKYQSSEWVEIQKEMHEDENKESIMDEFIITKENKILISEIKEFQKYCIDFYHIKYGVYPIATPKQIKDAIKVFLMVNDMSTIKFDSVDREKVRTILNK